MTMPGGERDLLKESLLKLRELRAQLAERAPDRHEPIAIIGAACRFPGAPSLTQFWTLLRDGRDAITDVPRSRWDVDRYFDPDPDAAGRSYLRAAGFLQDVEHFDAEFFGITPREAMRLDPQHRLLLEVAWEALEHAGIASDSLRCSSTGVYVGLLGADYQQRQVQELVQDDIDPYMLVGNEPSFAAGRLAYVLGLQGPAMVVSTACSSSLVSLHLACQALRAGECDQALAGGANVILDPVTNVMLSRLRAIAPDGRCKTFDAAADGYGRGEGCGIVVLARLSDAMKGGRRVLAVIRGSAVTHDGPSAGLTVPNGSGQEKVLRRALQAAGVDARDVSYVEAHGTGTPLGDPCELRALSTVFGGAHRAPLMVGSVKTNIGHLEAAAGIAGLLKVVLALQHREMPAHLNLTTPNPHVPWHELTVRVPIAMEAWTTASRIAGISSFGLSGVNAHVIVEEHRATPEPRLAARRLVLPLSARTAAGLEALVVAYQAALTATELEWTAICYTAATGRNHFEHRLAIVAGSAAEALGQLRSARRCHVRIRPQVQPPTEDIVAVAAAYMDGASVDWLAMFPQPERPRPVDLPTYPFQRRRFWALDPGTRDPLPAAPAPHAAVGAASFAAAVRMVMGLPADAPLDPEASLLDMGLDSLMAVELRASVLDHLHRDVALADLLSGRPVRELIDGLHGTSVGPPRDITAPAGAEPAERYPLSHGQRALWFIQQSAPGSVAYNIGIALHVKSRVEPAILTQAFQAVVASHPSLRARFPSAGGEPMQVIESSVRVDIVQHDAAGCSDDELRGRVEADYRCPFDLNAGPVLRVSLYTRSVMSHVLLVTIHHIACDATSCWTVLEQVQRAYAAALGGNGPALTPSASTYAAYVTWQRNMVAGEEGDRLWAFWRDRLGGELPALDLPADRPRPAVQTFRGDWVGVSLSPELTSRLRDFSRAHGATLFATLLAGFHALLHRLTGQTDLAVGSAAIARPPGFDDVVGYFVNPLVIRADLAGDPTFAALVAQVRAAVIAGLMHQQFPFPLIVERLRPRRDAARSPIFQADFSLTRPAPVYRPQLKALTVLDIERFELPEEQGQFDIGLHLQEDREAITGALKFNADLFDPATVERMARCWRSLIESAVANGDTPVSRLSLLDDAGRDRILAFGRGPVRNVAETTLVELVERQVRLTPAAPALRAYRPDLSVETITYGELNDRANRVARYLEAEGVGPGALVGVCMRRGTALVASLLGVMKAGAAYLPLDPAYPAARLAMIGEDARPACVLTGEAPAGARLETFSGSHITHHAAPDDLAYVIYTSGSTGTPKGTRVTHRGLTNYLLWAVDAYRVAEGSGAPVNTSIGFDATVTSLWLPLIAGRTVVLLPEEREMETLCELLANEPDFSLLKVTPAHLELLAHLLPDAAHRRAARALVIGGDVLRGEVLTRWRQLAPETRLINEYGPTETVVGCSIYEAAGDESGPLPIGRPVANTELYVVDRHGEPVPIGVTGEIYIGGAGVARGYLNRPELTDERFVTDVPCAPQARLYRTGDLGRWRADGQLEFIGRADDQVKIRGYRIEPAEIEATLTLHPAVAEAVVVAKRAPSGDRHLVAYLVAPGAVAPGDLRRFVAERLPEYMRPAKMVFVDALPLTAHGKVDREALPDPPDAPRDVTAPRDPIEARLAAIWEDVLGIPVGVRDDFFESGGHSLLVVKLMARVRETFAVDLPLSDILRAPTVEHLADLLRVESPQPPMTLVPLKSGGGRMPFFCVPGAGGNALYLYNLARQLGADQPVFGLQAAAPHDSIEAMAADYVGAVRAEQPCGPYAIGGHSLGAWVAFEMTQQLLRAGEPVAALVVIDTPVPHPSAFSDTSQWDQARWICELADRVTRLLDPAMAGSLDGLRALPEERQLAEFRSVLDRFNLFPGSAGERHLERILTLFKAHAQLRYALPPTVLPVPVTLLRTGSPPAHLAASVVADDWGWSAVGPVDVHVLPGDHLAVLRPPYVAALGKRLDDALARAGQRLSCPQPSF